ncbi:NCS2 family permease [Candidatus Poribacteria bacterium]|nr:NCS2 family permease [Candidatus Poribacteria bacterium]MYA55551.1 NCS2 family permease [Candidatus Poribacteria bacterium]
MLEKLFAIKENGTSLRREFVAGLTNFMTISYIIFVQPAMLSLSGMDYGAVMVATCLSSALATFFMAFLTNYPVVLAPGMGLNAYFVFDLCRGSGIPWQEALGIVFIAGMLFFILSFVGIREAIMNALPHSLQNAIAIGIGLFIAFIGLQMSGIITKDPATFITRGALDAAPVLLSLFGIAVTLTLIARKVRGAILIGILISTIANLIFGVASFDGIAAAPPSIAPTFFKLQLPNIFAKLELIPIIFVFFAIDMFDSIGTLTAIGYRAELLQEGKLTKARGALLTDAGSTVGGSLLGTSTVTCYIESATGITEGGRTGLTAAVTGVCMLLSLFLYPLVKIVGGGFQIGPSAFLYPIIAPALIVVGGLMLRNVNQIDWEDITESIPAFLTMLMMPLSFSITDGIGFGLISLAFLKLVTGRRKEIHPVIYYFALFFIACYIGDL